MAVPNSDISILKLARERKGFGYTSSTNITAPIFNSDLHRLTGGNSSGSGTSYPAINTLNPQDERPDGNPPEKFSEFIGYEQNVTLTAFDFIYAIGNSNDACVSGLPFDTHYHDDGNNLYPSALDGTFTAYQNSTGTLVASAGFYQVYASGGSTTGKFIQVGSNGSIIGGGNC